MRLPETLEWAEAVGSAGGFPRNPVALELRPCAALVSPKQSCAVRPELAVVGNERHAFRLCLREQ
jgi:hypothetical protein